MKVSAITIRPGNVLEYNEKLWVVLKNDIIQPGKGAAVVQVEMRDLSSGNKTNVRFRTQETVERARVDEVEYQFLFETDGDYAFMNVENYEQITISSDLIGDPKVFLQDGMIVQVQIHDGNPLGVALPDQVTMQIVEADPVVKGQTASSSYKPAVLENGVRVMVPPHIESGTRIVVKTADNSYVERAKD
ncbi:MAG: elongation factor P [Pseudomonadota bacterium]|jgi:elongation factor P|nr:elongation factor P [Pseudomonadota bacterium]QKK04346.1 MAG: elongation factor P [Pseudomonadota bacterium]